MADYSEVRLIKDTKVEIIDGVVYTTIVRDGCACTVALLLHDYLLHHQRAAKAIDEAFAVQGEVIAWK